MAAETLVGAGEMVLRMRKHPAQLRDGVCSPGGLTIKGVAKLEEKGFKSAVIEAVKETYYKAD
jgi:pyrroline-5-carboxylate reductase